MTTQNSKIIISYNGGSAGDLFVKSCNDEILHELRFSRVVQHSTLKNYEHKVRMGIDASLDEELNLLPYRYVNTHMLDEVIDKGYEVYNIIITDPKVQHQTIYRQMQIQQLRIQVDNNDWYTTIRNYCLNKDYTNAAIQWYKKAENLWIDRMAYRISFKRAKVLNFNSLYTLNFVDSLIQQGWHHNISLLRNNHSKWLEENHSFGYEKTIETMANKLSKMDWYKTDGWVEYNPHP